MKIVRTLAFAFVALTPVYAIAQDAGCDVDYVVQPGDTLHGIAETAYGDAGYQLGYQLLLSRNLSTAPNPQKPTVGVTVVVPCIADNPDFQPDVEALKKAMAEGGADALETRAEAEAEQAAPAEPEEEAAAAAEPEPTEAAEETAAADEAVTSEQPIETEAAAAPESVIAPEPAATEPAAPEPEPEPAAIAAAPEPTPEAEPQPQPQAAAVAGKKIRLLNGGDLPPFDGHDRRGDGMAMEIVKKSLARADVADRSRVITIGERESHLQDLLIDGSFDIGFPWYKPDCDDIEKLAKYSEHDAWFCRNFEFSEAFYEFVYGFFVRKGEFLPGRAIFSDFAGARICRPEGPELMSLTLRGLGEDEAEYMRPKNLGACFDALMKGDVDAVIGEVFSAEDIIASRNLDEKVEELPDLSVLQTINAVAPRSKPESIRALGILNKGLIDMKLSGEWFRVVRRHLAM